MEIRLAGISKRFTGRWLFKDIQLVFASGNQYVITGDNGTGKTTLLLVVAGWISPTAGRIEYLEDGIKVPPDKYYRTLDFVAPQVELIEDLTLHEFLHFHFHLNPFPSHFSIQSFLEWVYLERESGKYIKNFSTGMKQRLKLGLGMFSANPVLLMDEPTSNLDPMGKVWFREHFERIKRNKLILMASNQPEEIELCPHQVRIEKYQ